MAQRAVPSGVILAAGKDIHMAPPCDEVPRALLPIGNTPLAQLHLEAMADAGVHRVILAVGEHADAYRAALRPPDGMTLEYATRDSELGIAHALYQLNGMLDEPFVLALGDVFTVPTSYRALCDRFADDGADAVIAARIEPDPALIARNFAVVADASGRVSRVLEKAAHAPSRLKGVGVYAFDVSIFDALRRTPRSAVRDAYELTDAIQIFIDDDHDVRVWSDVERDVNLTVPRDLLIANLARLRDLGVDAIVADDVDVPAGASVESSVIGAGVQIAGAPVIRNSLVLPGSRIHGATELDGCLVAPRGTLPFGDVI